MFGDKDSTTRDERDVKSPGITSLNGEDIDEERKQSLLEDDIRSSEDAFNMNMDMLSRNKSGRKRAETKA